MKLLELSFLFALIATSASADEGAQFDRVIRDTRFEDVQMATNLLQVVVEGHGAKTGLHCLPPIETAQIWMSGPLHALSDAKNEAELKTFTAHPEAYKSRITTCLKTCSCNAFSALLEPVKDNAAYKKTLKKESAKETEAQSLTCARHAKAFCGSAIERYLKSQN